MEIQSKTVARSSIHTLILFKITFRSDSYLMKTSRRDQVTPPTPTFPNTSLKKQLVIYLLF